MADRQVPADFDELVARWDRFIVSTIRHVSRGHVRPDDIPDLKQAVYLRIFQKNYLERCRVLIGERGGSFSTYLFLLVRSVVINTFKKNTRAPTNLAVPIVYQRSGATPTAFALTDALIYSTYRQLVDDRFERQFEATDWLDRFEAHLESTARASGPVVTLPDGARECCSLALVFRLYRKAKAEHGGNGWAQDIASALRIDARAVFRSLRKIRDEAVVFSATCRPAVV